MKIIRGMPDMRTMTEDEVNKFLESRLNMQLATVDEKGDPLIQPVWFLYDKAAQRSTLTLANIRRRPTIYFSIDTEEQPYKCVKGKADAAVLEDSARNTLVVEKIVTKYLGTLDHPLAKDLVGMAKNGMAVVLELTPRYYSTWDFAES